MNLQKRIEIHEKKLIILQQKLKLLVIILSLIPGSILKGQDIHFSQYFNSPLNLNPSLTGDFEGDWRAYGNYRNQWGALAYPFRTFNIGYDRQISIGNQNLSLGAYVLNDQSGSVALKCNQAYLSAAYHRVIDNNTLSGGLQVGYVMKSVNYDKLAFPADWNGAAFDPSSINDQLSYLDINVGFGWRKKINKFEPEVGLSFFHINQPSETFYAGGNSSKVPMRSAFNLAVKTELSPTLYVTPGVLLYMMRGSRNMMLGSQAGLTIPGNRFNVREVYGGLYVRNGIVDPVDAMMVMFGAQFRKIAVNVSYDLNISSLRTYTNYRGAFELSFVIKSITAVIKTFTLPCERI